MMSDDTREEGWENWIDSRTPYDQKRKQQQKISSYTEPTRISMSE